MFTEKGESNSKKTQKSLLILILVLIITFSLVFKNVFLQSSLILKSFGELSVDPEIALANNKPTFLEFYAEWCEVCKEMAPKVADLRKEYKSEINFVFLNVDNPKWGNYIQKFDVNGIPQVNLLDAKGNLRTTFIGKQDEQIVNESLKNLNNQVNLKEEFLNSDFSSIKETNNYQVSARSHG